MSDQPPQWGEPGYVPVPMPKRGQPGYVPPRKLPKPPKVPLKPGQRRALWFALGLAVLGQGIYWVAFFWGTADCYQVFGHPGVALAGFLVSVAAIAFAVPVVRLWPRALPTFALVVSTLVVLNPAFEYLLTVGASCG